MGFLSSLFSPSKKENALDDQQKSDLKKFDILKYDGIRAQRVGKTDYAVKCFIEALKIQPDFETMKYLMSSYFMLNRLDDAIEVLNEMVETGEESANTLLTRANLLYSTGKHSEAIADCMQIIETEPNNHLAYFQSAKSERVLDHLETGIDQLSKAIDIKDDFAESYMLRAEIYLSLKKGTDALPDIEKVIGLTPEDETAYLLRGRIHELLGDSEAAFDDYKEASALNPFNEDAYLLAGRLMMTQEKYDEAIELFDEAIEHNEQFTEAYAERGRAKDKKGDKEGAAEDTTKAEELAAAGKEKQNTENRGVGDLIQKNII